MYRRGYNYCSASHHSGPSRATGGNGVAKITRILVPGKGHPTDSEAISLACNIAKRDKGVVFAIYVIEVKRTLPLDAENDEEVAHGEQVLEATETYAAKADYRIETELLQAREVGPAIVDEAADRKADLIILGAPYQHRYGQYHLGRTIPYVLEHAGCRVWVIREGATAGQAAR